MTTHNTRLSSAETINIVWRERRVIRNWYQCEECPLEWSDDLLVRAEGWCPCCDQRVEPYYTEEFEVTRPEFSEDE